MRIMKTFFVVFLTLQLLMIGEVQAKKKARSNEVINDGHLSFVYKGKKRSFEADKKLKAVEYIHQITGENHKRSEEIFRKVNYTLTAHARSATIKRYTQLFDELGMNYKIYDKNFNLVQSSPK